MSDDCLFCDIVHGKIDSHILYEDGDALAFLDVNPVSDGHALVIPKTHADTLTDLDGEETAALFRAVRDVAQGLQDALDPAGLNLLQSNGDAAGQEIPHMHVHLIPRYDDGDGFDFSFDQGDLDADQAQDLVERVAERL